MELVELTDVFAATGFNAQGVVHQRGSAWRAVRVDSRSRLDDLTDTAKRWGPGPGVDAGRARRGRRLSLNSPIAKFLSEAELSGIGATRRRRGRSAVPGRR